MATGLRIINDPEGLNRVVVEHYVDDWVWATCYLAPGTKLNQINERCKQLMEGLDGNNKLRPIRDVPNL